MTMKRRQFLEVILAAGASIGIPGCKPDSAKHTPSEHTPQNSGTDAEHAAHAMLEIANHLIKRDRNGTALGAVWLASLDRDMDGTPLVKIYPDSWERSTDLVNQHWPATVSETKPLRETLRQWMLEEYSAEFPALRFTFTSNPLEANIIACEATFIPNAQHPQPDTAEHIKNNPARTQNARVANKERSMIFFNVGGCPEFARRIEAGEETLVKSTLLNEMMNALGTIDLQEMDRRRLSPATNMWIDATRREGKSLNYYTVTHSAGPKDDVHLKQIDQIIVSILLSEAGQLQQSGLNR